MGRRKRDLYGGLIGGTTLSGMTSAAGITAPIGSASEPNGYDLQALKYAGQHADPYEQMALNYKQAGRRFPDPQGAERSLYYRDKIRTQTSNMPWIGSESPYGAASVAGVRQTQQGIIGKSDPRTDYYPDSRIKADMKVNVWNDEWGAAGIGFRRSGSLTTGTMEQAVNNDFPWLQLGIPVANSANSAIVRIQAGMSEGGMESIRTFFLGGGFTVALYLAGYDNVRLTVTNVNPAGVVVGFAWVVEGNQGGNLSIYRPFIVTAGMIGVPQPVPQGAFEMVPAATDPAWSWTAPLVPGFAINGITAGATQPVLGNLYTPGIANNITWILRPI